MTKTRILIALMTIALPLGIANAQVQQFCNTTGFAIPDNSPAGASSDITVPAGGTIVDIDVTVDATHTWVGDLIFTVQHVDTGTTVTVIDRPGYTGSGFGCANDNANCDLDDAGTDGPVEAQCNATPPALFGNPTPNNALSAFNGEAPGGTWRLTVSDNAGGDTGTLNSWCVQIDGAVPVELQTFTVE